MTLAKFRSPIFGAVFSSFTLTACTNFTDDQLAGDGQALAMVPANHTDRYAVHIFIDKYWAGDVSAQAGGTKAACCFPGRKDWSKPISVTWEWGREEDAETKAITMPAEKHSALVNFPAHGPHQDPNWRKSDAYLCVIFRDLNTVALAFSPSGTECLTK
ncbi:DUF3304 domain-containing protein [Burkholderia gladioli]|uniref:DUF3304 domain-containing protein n=1 Tax=Burkholderia gladioli (strain BSR3) TaxID=999541 RepID=F2LGK4_BURGS|nr:DUF3304 domain-containing protein [Burkholderia gladioli]AEA58714.1 hypothetical protein bgla_1g00100 [Burkholderia gladioli BSR3]MBW5282812.1 DUF3304 domain-containing protein [Burkholderia gladioli]